MKNNSAHTFLLVFIPERSRVTTLYILVLNCSAYAAQAPGLMILSLGYFAMNVFLCCEPTKENGTQVKKIKLRVFIGQAGNPASYPATS